jgi:hypothetical protein
LVDRGSEINIITTLRRYVNIVKAIFFLMASPVPAADDAFEMLATHRIRAAIKAGEFDNLEGSGKPLPKCDHDQDVVAKVGGST